MQRQVEGDLYLINNYLINNYATIEEISAAFPELIFDRIAPTIYTVTVPEAGRAQFEDLRQRVRFVFEPIPYGLNAQEALEASNILAFHNYPFGQLRGTGVLIGFVDTGINYANPLFINADGTSRVAAIWDQTIEGNPPNNFSYGSLYTKEVLNEALENSNPYSVVPTRDENGHGTFLAGVAAGYDQSENQAYTGGAPEAEIVMVKLRPASESVRDTFIINQGVPAYQNNDIIAGLSFLVQQALVFLRPMVICIGLGNNYGAHNGTEVLEDYLAQLSLASDIVIVVAAGNEGGSGHHYRGTVGPGEVASLEINVAENEAGFRMYLWVGLPNKMTISITSPLGQVIEKISLLANEVQTFNFNLEATVLRVVYTYPDPLTGAEEIIVRLQAPTPGLWTLRVYGDSIIDGIFHIWLPRRDFITNGTRFLRPDPEVTVQIPGTETYSISVGAYDYLDDSVYVNSGRGPTTDNIIKPDLLAPGVNVEGPSITGGLTTYVGTSTAAAITASAAALMLQWGIIQRNFPYMNTRIVRGLLMRGARRNEGVDYPNPIEGYGRLDLRNTISRA